MTQNTPANVSAAEKIRNRNTKIGLCWLLIPLAAIIVILMLWAGIQNVSMLGGPSGKMDALKIVSIILSIAGVAAIICLIVGIPVGIVYLNKKEPLPEGSYDQRSGKGRLSEVPQEIKGWNWGAIGVALIWGLAHRVWWSLLIFVPYLNLFILIYLGIKGNELAWRSQQWESVEKFKAQQEKWKVYGIVFFVLGILGRVAAKLF